ncbi:MAG TPA: hypothetical protein VGP99_11560 [Tepidisphaeraceae bacterium]|jgi:Arc/MetJ-type ribon-helix-helix transcriptional regulator|nr:hypothetical protein [Tepidisphaeraceae bacterium]
MTVHLKPDLARFIDGQLKSGRFKTAEDAVNAMVARAQLEEELSAGEIDDNDLAAIDEGLARLERGEGIPWEHARKLILKKYLAE